MEGLDLFNPVNRLATEDDSPSPTPSPYNDYWDNDEDESEEEGEEEMSEGNYDMEMEDDEGDIDYIEPTTRQRRSTELNLRVGKTRNEGEDGGEGVDMIDGLAASFHVEKQQGLKLTFRKRGRQEMSSSENSSEPPVTKVIIIHVQLLYMYTRNFKSVVYF